MSVLALAGLTACSTWHRESDRTAGRMVDDNRITNQVKHELNREPTYKFTDVDVKTFAGVVQLSGFVNSNEQKQRAAQIAQSVPGVTQVIDSIALKPQPSPSPTGRTASGHLEQNQISAPTTTTNTPPR